MNSRGCIRTGLRGRVLQPVHGPFLSQSFYNRGAADPIVCDMTGPAPAHGCRPKTTCIPRRGGRSGSGI
jgi:hypothetical protein